MKASSARGSRSAASRAGWGPTEAGTGSTTSPDGSRATRRWRGEYHGYDGPAPPWNDSILHHYVFTLYALDIPNVSVEGSFTAADVRQAIEGHVLAEDSVTGTYTQNPTALVPGPISSR